MYSVPGAAAALQTRPLDRVQAPLRHSHKVFLSAYPGRQYCAANYDLAACRSGRKRKRTRHAITRAQGAGASDAQPEKRTRQRPIFLRYLQHTVQHITRNFWPIMLLHAVVDVVLYVSYRVLHRILNQVAISSMHMDPALIGNPWWVAAGFNLNDTLNTGYGRMMSGCFLLMLLYSLLLKCFANCATINLCREGTDGLGLSWRPPLRRGWRAILQAAKAVRPLFAQVAQVELLVWVRLLPLLAFSLLILPLPLTLPRIGNLLLATPVSLIEGVPEELAIKRAQRVIEDRRRPLLISMAIPVFLVRLLGSAKQGGMLLLPPRFYKDLPEIPIAAFLLLVAATTILCRVRELLPYSVYADITSPEAQEAPAAT